MTTLLARIMDIPARVFTKNILPFCEARDAISLGCTNKFFALITTDETFWKQKLAVDYSFTHLETPIMSSWKLFYRRFRNPRIFVWGCVTFPFCYVTGAFICSSMHLCDLAGTIQRE